MQLSRDKNNSQSMHHQIVVTPISNLSPCQNATYADLETVSSPCCQQHYKVKNQYLCSANRRLSESYHCWRVSGEYSYSKALMPLPTKQTGRLTEKEIL